MKLGTSLRFLFPTGEQTYPQFRRMLDAMAPGGFAERPMGAFDTAEQANNVLELAKTASIAKFDGLLFGDSHGVTARYANAFSPIPTVARLLAVTGDMPVGMVILAPFYQPIILAEQIGTLAAFARAPLTIVLANGGGPNAFKAFGYEMGTRARRLEHVRARRRIGARLQSLVKPLTKRFGGGCEWDRDTLSAIRGAGFDIEAIHHGRLAFLPIVVGTATAPAS